MTCNDTCGAGKTVNLFLRIQFVLGIDVVAISSHPGHLLVLDCEGGNNAMSKSHSIVTVVGDSNLKHQICTCMLYTQYEDTAIIHGVGCPLSDCPCSLCTSQITFPNHPFNM